LAAQWKNASAEPAYGGGQETQFIGSPNGAIVRSYRYQRWRQVITCSVKPVYRHPDIQAPLFLLAT